MYRDERLSGTKQYRMPSNSNWQQNNDDTTFEWDTEKYANQIVSVKEGGIMMKSVDSARHLSVNFFPSVYISDQMRSDIIDFDIDFYVK